MKKLIKPKLKVNKLPTFIFFIMGVVLLVIIVLSYFLVYKNRVIMNESVKDYLASANFEGDGQEITKGDEIVVDYIGRLKDGTVFDTSIELIAKGSDKYNENRDYNEGLAFTVGAGQMIAGFDRAVEGMKIGQTKTIEIPAKDAYGEWNKEHVVSVPKAQLQLPGQYKEGEILYAPNGQAIKVYKVTETEIMLDMNHELAGKTLIFDITIKEIK